MEKQKEPRPSAALVKAIQLMRRDPLLTITQAAQKAKVARSTIYRSSQYKALMAERKEQQQ